MLWTVTLPKTKLKFGGGGGGVGGFKSADLRGGGGGGGYEGSSICCTPAKKLQIYNFAAAPSFT